MADEKNLTREEKIETLKIFAGFSDEQKTEVEKVYSDMKQLIAELTPDQPAEETPAAEEAVTEEV